MNARASTWLVLAPLLVCCGPLTEDPTPAAPAACTVDTAQTHAVDPFKELLVVDEAVARDASTTNASNGALSFRHVMEQLSGTADAADFALRWASNAAPAAITCQWLRSRRENACDDACGVCRERKVDLAHSPFRWIGIANRMDLAEEAPNGNGEGRLLFAVTDGPGDDLASRPLPITVIFEFELRGSRAEWAAAWHALGQHADFDASYIVALRNVTERFIQAGTLAQVRVLDAQSVPGGAWSEYHLGRSIANGPPNLVRSTLRRTPSHALDGTDALQTFVRSHSLDIVADRYDVPDDMLAQRLQAGQRWELPGVDEALRRAFAAGTCDGCHGQEHAVVDGAFHVSPLRAGIAKVSPFLYDPAHPGQDELSRRALLLSHYACAP